MSVVTKGCLASSFALDWAAAMYVMIARRDGIVPNEATSIVLPVAQYSLRFPCMHTANRNLLLACLLQQDQPACLTSA